MKNVLIIFVIGLFILSCTSNQKKEMTTDENPFFGEFGTPFEVPAFDKIKPEHFMPAFHEGMQQQLAEIETIVNNSDVPTFENSIVARDGSGELLTSVRNVFNNLSSAATDEEIQKISKEVAPILSAHFDNIALNEGLFARVKAVYENKEKLDLNTEQAMLLDKTYKNFVRGGANLEDDKKERFKAINKELSLLNVQFGENQLAETNAFQLVIENEEDLAGLPQFVMDMGADDAKAAGMEGKWVYTLNKPSLIPFLQYADKRELRGKIFKAYINRCNNDNEFDNKKIAAKMASLRVERAKLLGFDTHAHYILDNNMAKTPENVYKLMDQVWEAAVPVAKNETVELQKLIDAEGGDFNLEAWDWWYYTEKLRKQKFDLDDEQLKPYFELSNVKEGMFVVAKELWGLTFELRDNLPVPHEDAMAYEVFDADGSHLSILYMDFHPRASKESGAWMSSYRKQSVKDGKFVTPVITMVMNFSKPTGDTPSLLTFEEVSTMFHEFGHALHGMLSDCNYISLSGTSVSRDFVELPSQIMENWAGEPEVLKMYAKHYKTGEVIPDELIEKMKASSHFNQGFITVEYTAAAYLDMSWHTLTESVEKETLAFEKEALNKIGLIPEIVVRYRSPYFAHIFAGGYSSGYYGYQWAAVLDADAFEAFKETSLFDKETAKVFRENILERGGTDDPMKLYKQFRGAEPSTEPMLRRKGLI